ncbi:hypothetical protein [Gluconobacter wancherniae]|uniref:Aminotransferase class V domain-containing protein n=1 Tax=Gluconobacter wancherniae NBRC 103581 TaxID=656744 RepID=A0A511B438_9PROT|nr:hypothetical protein [Gluconobacter wancherniae]MBF0854633.1 hypothetical protein [Gluconobacter wancherniae]GBD57639.1 hypothetical protein NBRC103581_02229 [Gluconobacter wancherniae NBRC 103581]GEK94502.1 hypothetical protein GWA01_22720 [Gluconobacter wancherniae NBRC 103581]
MLADVLTDALTRVLERPDLRVVADGLMPALDMSLPLPFRLVEGATRPLPGMKFTLKLGRQCMERPELAPTILRHAIELMRLLESGVHPAIASFAAARVAALFHALDTTDAPPLPDFLTSFSTTAPDAATLLQTWPQLSGLLPVEVTFTAQNAERLQPVLAGLWPVIAPAETLMSSGGDSRLSVDPVTGLNRYSCSHRPRPWAVTFGSSTASSLSERGFGGAESARRRMMATLLSDHDPDTAQEALVRTAREAIGRHFGLSENAVLLSASGTDCELAVLAIVAGQNTKPISNILIAPDETGSGVPLAARGRHFATDSACASTVGKGDLIEGFDEDVHLLGVAIRHPDGTARPVEDIDAECRSLAMQEFAAGRHVLLHRLDQSKTGIAAPSMALVDELRLLLGSDITVVVDACQARLSPHRVTEWVESGIMVMVTGSKFFTGPPFCGAILLPDSMCATIGNYKLPKGLRNYSHRDEWPEHADDQAFKPGHNIGLALRWHAAIAEMDALFVLPDAIIRRRLNCFMTEARKMLDDAPALTPLPVPARPDDGFWDAVPTILSFLVQDPNRPGAPLNLEDARHLHKWLNADLSPWIQEGEASLMCVLGQPVPVSHPDVDGYAGALRLCAGARLVSGEPSHEGLDEARRLKRECTDAQRVLLKLELIRKHWNVLLDVNPAPRYAPYHEQ